MKNVFKILCAIALLFSANFASGQARYDQGDVLLSAGIGLGYYYAGGVPLQVSAEYAVNDVISVGPYLGFTSHSRTDSYTYFGDTYGYKYNYTFIDIGGRASYHFSELLEIYNEKIDVYAGAFLGFLISNYSAKEIGNTPQGYATSDAYGGGLRAGIHAGARYFFSEKVAGYGELGYGIAPLSLGLTFKL